MEQLLIEIKAAEGGNDSKLLVAEMASIYKKAANNNNISITSEN